MYPASRNPTPSIANHFISLRPFSLRPDEEEPYAFTLYDARVAPSVRPNRYYIRLVLPNHPGIDLVAAIIER
jgi:hypothetical protein